MRFRVPKHTGVFIAGALAGLCFAGPICGAISGLFWQNYAGGSTEYASAKRIIRGEYWRAYSRGDLEYHPAEPLDGCAGELQLLMSRTDMEDKTALIDNVYRAIKNEEDRRKDALDEAPKLNALMSLSYPMLGALEGCLGSSLLSPFCRAYVTNLVDEAMQKAQPGTKVQIAATRAQMNEVFCLALQAITPSPSSD